MAKRREHPFSEAQRRWAFAAEERGELPSGKALEWSRRVKGKKLPKHSHTTLSPNLVGNEHLFNKVNQH